MVLTKTKLLFVIGAGRSGYRGAGWCGFSQMGGGCCSPDNVSWQRRRSPVFAKADTRDIEG